VYLRRAVAADKSNKQAWNNLGFALAMQGKYTESIEVFHKAVSPAEAQANLGFVLTVQGRPVEAARAYRQALTLEPTLKTAQAALVRLEGGAVPPVEPTGPIGPGPVQPAGPR
jgi:Flp pilus assembly protein TadD